MLNSRHLVHSPRWKGWNCSNAEVVRRRPRRCHARAPRGRAQVSGAGSAAPEERDRDRDRNEQKGHRDSKMPCWASRDLRRLTPRGAHRTQHTSSLNSDTPAVSCCVFGELTDKLSNGCVAGRNCVHIALSLSTIFLDLLGPFFHNEILYVGQILHLRV